MFVRIVPFSVETTSEGNPYLFQLAILASSVKSLTGLILGLHGIELSLKYLTKSVLINYSLNFLLNGPV